MHGCFEVMRAFTGRDKVIKFDGCYNGHADMFLVKAGSGVATLGLPDSPVFHVQQLPTPTAPYNDLEAVKKLFSENPDAISGLFFIVGNAGFITPEPGFLEGLRELTTENGSLLFLRSNDWIQNKLWGAGSVWGYS